MPSRLNTHTHVCIHTGLIYTGSGIQHAALGTQDSPVCVCVCVSVCVCVYTHVPQSDLLLVYYLGTQVYPTEPLLHWYTPHRASPTHTHTHTDTHTQTHRHVDRQTQLRGPCPAAQQPSCVCVCVRVCACVCHTLVKSSSLRVEKNPVLSLGWGVSSVLPEVSTR